MDGAVRVMAGCAGKGWIHWHVLGLVLWLTGGLVALFCQGAVGNPALPLQLAHLTVREKEKLSRAWRNLLSLADFLLTQFQGLQWDLEPSGKHFEKLVYF